MRERTVQCFHHLSQARAGCDKVTKEAQTKGSPELALLVARPPRYSRLRKCLDTMADLADSRSQL